MNPLWSAALRRHWPLVGAGGIFLVFLALHLAVFRPAANRYQSALQQAHDLGLAFDPTQADAIIPPRVFALIGDNSMASASANDQGSSGVLAARLLEDVTRMAENRGLDAVQTEPGSLTNGEASLVVRAHLKLRGSYAAFVGLLDDLAHQHTLCAVERFTLTPSGAERFVDLWVSRLILKHDRRAK